jgi:hypothetical protein
VTVPLPSGYLNSVVNIQPLCHGVGGCNNFKGAKSTDYREGPNYFEAAANGGGK